MKPLFKPPLRTSGRYILDADDVRFKLASINWYGASDELFVVGGLDVRHRRDIALTIRQMGFNSVRLPYSDELVITNPLIPSALVAANPDLVGKTALEVFWAVCEALGEAGIAVIVNNHITHARWFDGLSLCDARWNNDSLGPACRIRQSEEDWIRNWETVMRPLVKNPWVVGADLRNEVHGFWGTLKWSTWAAAAERCGNRLGKVNPEWLMVVEGISSANDLKGVQNRRIKLALPDRVVYSAHCYSWSGWGELQTCGTRTMASFESLMQSNWGYILDQKIAPVWMGEFGAPDHAGEKDANYWQNLIMYLEKLDVDFGYWALNPRKPHLNERESYGLLQDDWKTVVEDYRLEGMRRLMNHDDHVYVNDTSLKVEDAL